MNDELSTIKSIAEWKAYTEKMLPAESEVIRRNHAITSIYAKLYWSDRQLFKWAGMAAFASHHVGFGLLPFMVKPVKLLDIKTSCSTRGLANDLNLIRHLNNRIFDDIAWTHFAYQEHGIELLRELMTGHSHYGNMLEAFELLETGKQLGDAGHSQIWTANTQLLRHEQEFVVQPVFNRLGAIFQNVLTFCASLDFSPSHTKTNWRYHSSFLAYMYLYGKGLMMETKSFPNLTILRQRWEWLETKIIENWKRNERNDEKLPEKFEWMMNLYHAEK